MGTINPLQQHTHKTNSLSLHPQKQKTSAEAETTEGFEMIPFLSLGTHDLLCDPAKKLNEGSAPLLFLWLAYPLHWFHEWVELNSLWWAVVNTALPKNVLLFWAYFGMGIEHPGCVKLWEKHEFTDVPLQSICRMISGAISNLKDITQVCR